MRRRGKAVIGMVLAVLLAAGACAKEERETFTGGTIQEPAYQDNLNAITPAAYGEVEGLSLEPGTYISIIGKAEDPAYWRNIKEGVMQAAEDLNKALGYTGNDKIKVTYNGPAREEDLNEQVNILDEELSRNPDVIGIASVDEEACTVQFDLATWNGIPIIALDSGNQYQGIQCTVKTDNQDAARTGAYKLADEIGREGGILLLAHDSKSETAKERVQSFQEEITENYPDVHMAAVVYCDELDELKKQMAEERNAQREEEEREITAEEFSDEDAVQYVMEQHPDLKGVFGTNPAATQLGLRAIQQAEREEKQEKEKGSQEKENKKAPEDTEDAAGTEEGPAESEKEGSAATEESADTDRADSVDPSREQEETRAEEQNEADGKGEEKKEQSEAERKGEEKEEQSEADEKGEEKKQQEEQTEEKMPVVLMGFDAGEEQLRALEDGEIAGLIVQNPFGIGYASVVAAARTVLQVGNEAEVKTGYIWLTKENMEEESIQKMLYK